MSGPTTVLVTGDPLVTLLSAAAIRAAQAIVAGQAEAERLQSEHAGQRQARQAAQDDARAQGTAALAAEAERAEAELAQLRELASRLAASATPAAPIPARPAEPAALAAYVRGLAALCEEMRAILLTEAARTQDEAGEGAMRDIAVPAAHTNAAAPGIATPAATAQRLMERIAHLGPPPADLAELARELIATHPGERAELLVTELRRRIQAHLEALRGRMVEEATATIVEHSLKELGYQVEEVAHTLFVEGGVVHFRKPGWGDYMVRMRVDAQAGTANFNVVRAVEAGDNERSVLDHIAEDRWCAEFPALLQALAAYGFDLKVTRRLAAGELPVQLVARDKLPHFVDEEAAQPAARLLAREIK